jgi:hypothetical protein
MREEDRRRSLAASHNHGRQSEQRAEEVTNGVSTRAVQPVEMGLDMVVTPNRAVMRDCDRP